MPSLNPQLLRSAAVAALGSFLFGFDSAVISGATEALRLHYGLSSQALGFTVASALLGTIVGSLGVGPPAESSGRRPVLAGLAVLYMVSAIGCGLAWSWPALLVFRFIGGLAIGGSSVAAPMYIAEIAPAAVRGRLVALSQLNIVVGILIAYLSNSIVELAIGGPESAAWRMMLALPAVPAVIFYLLVRGVPESPRWLLKQGRRAEGEAVLARVGCDDPAAGRRRGRRIAAPRDGGRRRAVLHPQVPAADPAGPDGGDLQPAVRHQRAHLLHRRHLRDGRRRPHQRACGSR